jgi:hypothetical protein
MKEHNEQERPLHQEEVAGEPTAAVEQGGTGAVDSAGGDREGSSATDAGEVHEEKIQHVVTFDLTEEEFVAKGRLAAQLNAEISKLNLEFDVAKRKHKAETSLKEEEIDRVLSIIRRGKEDREVEVTKVIDYYVGIVRFLHKGRLVEERPMRNDEKQMRARL